MAATGITIFSTPNGVLYRDGISLRPQMKVKWNATVSPYDVTHEWDTVDTFDSGDLVSDVNNVSTADDVGVPPSDLGGDQTWYYRVTVKDSDTKDEVQTISIVGAEHGTTPTVTASNNQAAAANVVDGDEGTSWNSGAVMGTYTLDFDFAAAVDLSQISILESTTGQPTSVQLYHSDDGSAWTSIGVFSITPGAWSDMPFGESSHRYWRIKNLNGSGAYYWTVFEMKFYGVATSGTWRLDYDSSVTSDLVYSVSLAAMETALEGLTGITAVTVTGVPGKNYVVTFDDPAITDMVLLAVDDNSLLPTPSIDIAETVRGHPRESTVYPSAGTHTIVFAPSYDVSHFLHLNKNIVFAFGLGEVDDGVNVPHFLHLNKNVITDQPCPWLNKITPTISLQGGVVVLYGDSFGALASTYQTEIRLYEDADFSGTYVLMSATAWADDQISVTVPAGAITGWIRVVQTNGLETCTGSAGKLLTVEQVPADPDAGWWLRTANRLNIQTTEHTVIPGNNVKTSFKKIMNAIGSGRLEIPLSDPLVNDFIDPVMRKGVLVQTYLDDRMRYGWYAEDLAHDYDEEGNAIAVISGRGMEVVALWNKILPHDYPASPTRNPTWIYGSTDNYVRNPGFDDAADDTILQNPGGEDGNDDDGNAEGWSKRGDNVVSYTAIQASEAMTDDWYIEVEASDNHSGITQSVTVTPNRVYHVRTYVKDPLASGMRVTLALGGADDIASTGTYANNFVWDNEILAELDNVARNPAANGLPGGATDGTWQVMDVEVMTGDEQTSLNITIQNDHHKTGVFNPFWMDSTEIEGWGLGLDPWKAYQPSHHASNSFRLQSVKTYDGSPYGLYLNPLSTWAGIEQIVPVNPLTKYTMSLWLWTSLLNPDDSYKLEAHKNDGLDSWIGTADEKVPEDEGWTQYQIIFTTDDTTEELVLRFVYSGPNNPGPAYIDSVSVVPGEPPSTAGVILNNILDAMNGDGKLTYLTRTFTDTADSRGQPWPSSLSMDLGPEESLYGVLSRLVALGHEWEIVPAGYPEGNTGFELNVYTARPFNSDTGIGTNWVNEPEGPVIMPGDATIGGRMLKTAFNPNTIMAIGDDGQWSRVTQHPWLDENMDASDPADHGYRDSFGSIEEVISVSAGDATTISQFADARLADAKDRERAIQLQMQRSSVIRPFYHINVGDSLFVDMPPTDPDPPVDDGAGGFTRTYPKRIRSLQADLAGEGSDITFQVDIDRVVYEDELAWYAMIAQLAERAPAGTGSTGTGQVSGSGGAVSVVTEGVPTGGVAAHTHSLKDTEIKDKAASGDVSGTLPGPLVVNAIKGLPFASAIPADTGGSVYWVYDRDTLTWTPTEIPPDLTTLSELDDVDTTGRVDEDILAYNDGASQWEPRSIDSIYVDSVPFSQLGAISTGSGTFRLYAPEDRTLVDVQISVGVAPSGGVVTVDINMDGTTVFTTQANMPEIADGEFVSALKVPDVTAWAAGSYLIVDVDASNGCEDLTVVVRYIGS